MKQTVHACFGHVLFLNEAEGDELVNVVIYTTSNNTMFIVQGFETRDGQISENTGSFKKSNRELPAETYTAVYKDNYKVWCYSPFWNKGRDPAIKNIIIDPGNEIVYPVGTKLFLCNGTLKIDDKEVKGPIQIRIKTEEKKLTAVNRCYGILFP